MPRQRTNEDVARDRAKARSDAEAASREAFRERQVQAAGAQQEALKTEALRVWLANGGYEHDFQSSWPSILRAILTSRIVAHFAQPSQRSVVDLKL